MNNKVIYKCTNLVCLICHQCPVFTPLLPVTSENSWSHISATYTSPLILLPRPSLVKLQTTPLRLTTTLYSEQIEVLFCCLVNILHTISDIYTTAKPGHLEQFKVRHVGFIVRKDVIIVFFPSSVWLQGKNIFSIVKISKEKYQI